MRERSPFERVGWPVGDLAVRMFDSGTRHLVEMAEDARRFEDETGADARLSDLFCLLEDCEGRGTPDEHRGATYRTLACVSRLAGLGRDLRLQFYGACERLGLSERHAEHIRERLASTPGERQKGVRPTGGGEAAHPPLGAALGAV